MRRKARTTAVLLGLRSIFSGAVLSGAVLSGAVACSHNRGLESAFAPSWRAEGEQSTRVVEGQQVLARLSNLKAPPNIPAVVGVTGRGLRGRTLPGGVVWHYVGPVDVLPSLAGDAVAFSGEGIVTVLDVKSGARRFHLPVAGRRLEGMGYDGQHYALLLVDSHDARPDELRIVDTRGQTTFSAATMSRLGTPYAMGGVALIPWNRQYVSAFDMVSGESIGRLLVRDAIHRVEGGDQGPWVLGAGASRVDERLLESVGEKAIRLTPPKLPGEPDWPIDGSKPRLPRSQPVALWAVPTFDGDARFFRGTYGYGYFEVVLGLDASTQRVKWANFFPRGMVGSGASKAGITACLEDGSIWQVTWSDGYAARVDTLDTRLKGCAVTPLERGLEGRRTTDLALQVRETISGTGAGMAAVHEVLLADLAKSEATRATHALLAIAQDPATSSALAARAATYLAGRRSGARAMIRALRENVPTAPSEATKPSEASEATEGEDGENVEDLDLDLPTARKRPPPVAALAEALSQMNARGAATVLALQLTLPSIDGADSRAVLLALGRLGGKKQLGRVVDFFSNYKNGGGDRALLQALELAAKFMLDHGGETERSLLLEAKSDVLTHPELAKSLEQLPLDPASPPATAPPATQLSPAMPPPAPSPPAAVKPRSTAP